VIAELLISWWHGALDSFSLLLVTWFNYGLVCVWVCGIFGFIDFGESIATTRRLPEFKRHNHGC